MKAKFVILASAALFIGLTAQAQNYYLAGEFNGWQNNANQMTGGPTQYDFTITGQTADAYGEIKVTDGTWDHTWPSKNVRVRYDSTGSATVHFYPGTAGDGWYPLGNRVGYNDTGNLTWGVAGNFNGWDGTQLQLTSLGNGVYSNNVTFSAAGNYEFKFQAPPGSWNNIFFGSDFGNGDANATYTAPAAETVPIVLDLPNGRFLIGNLAPPPVTNQVVFAVDMTYQLQLGLFHPGSAVFVAGDFNGWPGYGTGALALTNDPPYMGGSNTNIWYGTNTLVGIPGGVGAHFKFTQNDPSAKNSGWETSSDRTVTLLTTNGTLVLPVAVFSDLYPVEVLSAPTPVFFSVDMTGAVGTDSHVFDPDADGLYVNGAFVGWYAWAGGINPAPAPAGFELIRSGTSMVFTNTVILPAGAPISFEYKYGMDPNKINQGPLDNEAAIGQNHFRVIRNTALSPYVMPQDKWGNLYHEPFFSASDKAGGQLQVGKPAGGVLPVTWLGRPGARLQFSTNLVADWQDLPATDGTTWTTGSYSTNGFVSSTNWPVSDKAFFRLVKP